MTQMVKSESTLLPKIDFRGVKYAYFDYAGKSYLVANVSTRVFKAAVLANAPNWRFHTEYEGLLLQSELDLIDRWWLLNCLADAGKGLALYARFEQIA